MFSNLLHLMLLCLSIGMSAFASDAGAQGGDFVNWENPTCIPWTVPPTLNCFWPSTPRTTGWRC